jgi:hypothetical protein
MADERLDRVDAAAPVERRHPAGDRLGQLVRGILEHRVAGRLRRRPQRPLVGQRGQLGVIPEGGHVMQRHGEAGRAVGHRDQRRRRQPVGEPAAAGPRVGQHRVEQRPDAGYGARHGARYGAGAGRAHVAGTARGGQPPV